MHEHVKTDYVEFPVTDTPATKAFSTRQRFTTLACIGITVMAIGAGLPTCASAGQGAAVSKLTAGAFTVVIATGAQEPASIGSYSVRTYTSLQTGSFVDGVVHKRDGSIAKSWIDDLDADTPGTHIIVWCTSAGSGSYGSADVLAIGVDGHLSRVDVPKTVPPGSGYMGHDTFLTRGGSLYREHPVYRAGDSNRDPTGGIAVYVLDLKAREWLTHPTGDE